MNHTHHRRDEHVSRRPRTDHWLSQARTTSRRGLARSGGVPVAHDRIQAEEPAHRDVQVLSERTEEVGSEYEAIEREEVQEREVRESRPELSEGQNEPQISELEQPHPPGTLSDDQPPDLDEARDDSQWSSEPQYEEERVTSQNTEWRHSNVDLSHLRASQVRSSTGNASSTAVSAGSGSGSHADRQRMSHSVSTDSRRRGAAVR